MGDRRQEISSHELPGRRIDAAQRRLIEFCGRRPGIEPQRPQGLALIDVAYAGADALLKEQFGNAGGLRSAGAPDHFIQVERIDEDVGPQVAHRQPLVDDQLHEGSGKAHGNGFREGQHGSGAPLRLAPALARPVDMPGAGHPHVRMQRDPALEPHQQVFAVCVDRLEPPPLQSCDRYWPSVQDELAGEPSPQCGRGPPDRVAFRQGRGGAPARAPHLSASCRIRLRRACLPDASP